MKEYNTQLCNISDVIKESRATMFNSLSLEDFESAKTNIIETLQSIQGIEEPNCIDLLESYDIIHDSGKELLEFLNSYDFSDIAYDYNKNYLYI